MLHRHRQRPGINDFLTESETDVETVVYVVRVEVPGVRGTHRNRGAGVERAAKRGSNEHMRIEGYRVGIVTRCASKANEAE